MTKRPDTDSSSSTPPGAKEGPRAVALRQGGLFGGWAVTAAAAVLAAVLLVGGVLGAASWLDVVRALALSALIAWAGWLVGAFPRLVVSRREVTVVNLLRTTRLPRGLIEDVDDAGMVTLHTRRAGAPWAIKAWGAPSAPKPRYVSGREQRINERMHRAPGVATGARTGVVRALLGMDSGDLQSASSELVPEIRWNTREWLLLSFLLVINVAIWLR